MSGSKCNRLQLPALRKALLPCFLLAGFFLLCLPQAGAQGSNNAAPAPAAPAVRSQVVVRDSAYIADSLKKREIRKATIRSAILPGWGQVTNRQTWKLPLVYAAVGIPAYLFFFNLEQYKILRDAYIVLNDNDPSNDDDIPDNLKPLSENSIKFYRDEYRRNVDYSALAFLIAWGLNVVDATVFANLREFDVSDNLTMRVSPQVNPALRTAGVSIVLKPHSQRNSILKTR
ncbi:MAG: DUF5683 domain-containing protein [Chitinophagaceae bacterium]|nr:DUF5683 domain-containing protein [Chitinophagaceae bacterium]